MNAHQIIDAYVADIVRRVPGRQRHGLGLELRGLLQESLADHEAALGRPANDAEVLALLRDFGQPTQVAARYHPEGLVIIPAAQTRSFAIISVVGIVLQWALSLPQVAAGKPISAWWLSWGLGALWWPGLLVMLALATAKRRAREWQPSSQLARTYDPERVRRPLMLLGLVGWVFGVAIMTSLPWLIKALPSPLPAILAIDSRFLAHRSWPALLLWALEFAMLIQVYLRGRWSPLTRRLELACKLGWLAVLGWWVLAGPILQSAASDAGARGAIALVIMMIAIDLAYQLYRRSQLRRQNTMSVPAR